MAPAMDLTRLMRPRSIAVVGEGRVRTEVAA